MYMFLLFFTLGMVTNATELGTMEPQKFYFYPNTDQELSWKVISGELSPGDLDYEIIDFHGNKIQEGTASTTDNIHLTSTVNLPQGYYIIKFINLNTQFGLSVLPYLDPALEPDRFFAMHADLCHDDRLTYLSTEDQETRHENLFRVLYKTGIRKVRDRVRPVQFAPSADTWSWQGTTYRYEDARQLFNQYDIDVLGYFALSPGWMKRSADNISGSNRNENKYPSDMHALTETWLKIYDRWKNELEVIEIWNEPHGVVEDRVAPMVHAMAFAFQTAGHDVELATTAFAGLPKRIVTNMGQMGCWDAVDKLTFHTYASPGQMEGRTRFFTDHMATFDNPYMPISITECGQKYIGGLWPTLPQEYYRSENIIGNTVEARAAGVESMYPFFFRAAQFLEGDNITQHSMIDIYGTPFLSMASYVNAIIQLAHKGYLGDLDMDHPNVKSARIFGDGDTAVLVLYSDEESSISISAPVQNIYGMDGRLLELTETNEIPMVDRIVYAVFKQSDLDGFIKTNSSVMDLYERSNKSDMMGPRNTYPVVLQHFADYEHLEFGSSAYNMATIFKGNVPLTFQASNLSDQEHTFEVELVLPAWLSATTDVIKTITVPAYGTKTIAWYVRLEEDQPGFRGDIMLKSTATDNDVVSSVKFGVICPREVPEVLKSFTSYRKLDIYDASKWKTYGTNGFDLNLQVKEDAVEFGLEVPENKSWTDARFDLSGYDMTKVKGLLVVARLDEIPDNISQYWPKVSFGVEEENGSKYRGTSIPADGEVHWSYLEFNDLPLDVRDDNQTLDLDQIANFEMHTWHGIPEMTINFEIYDVYMVSDSLLFDGSEFDVNLEIKDKIKDVPIGQALVMVDTTEYSSNDSGMVALSEIPCGFYDFSIHADGYLPLEVHNIEIFKDTMITFEIAKDNPVVTLKLIDIDTKEPVYRATVQVNDNSYFTSNKGVTNVNVLNGGKLIFEASHKDYFNKTDTILIERDTSITVPMVRKMANVKFQVSDSIQLLNNVAIVFDGRSGFTGVNGELIFYGQPARHYYDYQISLVGYKTVTDSLFLESDTTLSISLETVTNTQSVHLDGLFVVYPNPFKSHFIVFSSHSEGTMVLRDLQGRKLFEKQLVLGKQTVQSADLPDGYYILNVKFGNHTHRVRVVKQSLINK